MIQILQDRNFALGFKIGFVDSLKDAHKYVSWKLGNEEPIWKLAQWCSKFSLIDENIKESNNIYSKISNEQKSITRFKDGSLILDISSDKEYDHDRLDGEEWPHLLIEQSFKDIKLSMLDFLNIDINFDFLSFKNHMKNPSELHTFQVTWYFCISNQNKNSHGYDDFFWFGIPFIDTPRLPMGKPYEAVDSGKADATAKYIINIDPKEYINKKTEVGDNFKFSGDILPRIKKAFSIAKNKGYLKSSEFEDMQLLSTNFGIEDTGTFDGAIKINNIDIYS